MIRIKIKMDHHNLHPQYQLKNSKNHTSGSPLMIISAKEPQPMANKYKVRATNSIQDSPIH